MLATIVISTFIGPIDNGVIYTIHRHIVRLQYSSAQCLLQILFCKNIQPNLFQLICYAVHYGRTNIHYYRLRFLNILTGVKRFSLTYNIIQHTLSYLSCIS